MMPHGPGPYLNMAITRLWLDEEGIQKCPKTKAEGREGRVAVWTALQEMKAKGKIRQLGVSNFNRRQLNDIMEDSRYVIFKAEGRETSLIAVTVLFCVIVTSDARRNPRSSRWSCTLTSGIGTCTRPPWRMASSFRPSPRWATATWRPGRGSTRKGRTSSRKVLSTTR